MSTNTKVMMHLIKNGVDTPLTLQVYTTVEELPSKKVMISNPKSSLGKNIKNLQEVFDGIDDTTLATTTYVQNAIKEALSGITFNVDDEGVLTATTPNKSN